MHTILYLSYLFFFLVPIANGAESAPVAFIQDTDYEFSMVLDGSKITHEFVIQNKGDAILKIEKVKTTWGCTAASYTKQIPPGGEGKITIEVETEGSGGKKLKKTITVFTNDEKNAIIPLTIEGDVEKFATILPNKVRFIGNIDNELKKDVRIIPEEKYPFKIVNVSAKKHSDINFELNEVKGLSKTEYVLTVWNLKKEKGRYHDTIYIKTSSDAKKDIKIHVSGNIHE